MDLGMIVLRIVHIGSGVLWVGGAILVAGFVEPTATELGSDAQKFMGSLTRRRLPEYFLIVSTLTVLAGALLYWRDSSGLDATWIQSPTGLGLTLGAIGALAAYVLGNIGVGRNIGRLNAIAAEIAAGGGPPTAAQLGRLRAAQHTIHLVGQIDAVLLAATVIAMSTSPYL